MSARYRDLDGWPNLETLYLAFADSLPAGEMAPGGVFLKYEQGENRLYLADSAGTTWGAGATPRAGAFLENGAAKVTCACGNTWTTGSTIPEIRADICSACHPFFTGKQKLVDTAGRIDRFKKRYNIKES